MGKEYVTNRLMVKDYVKTTVHWVDQSSSDVSPWLNQWLRTTSKGLTLVGPMGRLIRHHVIFESISEGIRHTCLHWLDQWDYKLGILVRPMENDYVIFIETSSR